MNFTENQNNNSQGLYGGLVLQSWKDESFKKSLINNPVQTIENFVGKPIYLKNGKQIVVEDQSSESVIYLNIPAQPKIDELELTEEQLEMIAGGGTPLIYTIALTIGITIGITGEVL